ncbi:MAG: hypothetical protein WDN45_12260 [Caulobacteraceae bacterium]
MNKERFMQVSKKMLVLAGFAAAAMMSAPGFRAPFVRDVRQHQERDAGRDDQGIQWTNPHSWVQIVVKDPATGRTSNGPSKAAAPTAWRAAAGSARR